MRAACTKCWKPKGALFSVVRRGVAGQGRRHGPTARKLKIVDPSATIQRYACTGCGVHMYGRIENKGHPFPWARLHPRRAVEGGRLGKSLGSRLLSPRSSSPVQSPSRWAPCARGLKELGLEPYDCLSPALMDLIATHTAKAKGVLAA